MGFILPVALGVAGGFGASALGAGTTAALAAGTGLAGAGFQTVGAISQGEAASAEASYAAQVARNNETVANQNANYATAAGETRAFNQELKERVQGQTLTADIAARGLDVNSGSAADLRESQSRRGEQDVETSRNDAALTAYGYRTQSANYRAEAGLDTAASGFDTEAGWLKGLGGLLSVAPNIAKLGGGSGSGDLGDWPPRGAT